MIPIFGIDISNNNGFVDLDRVKTEGFQFVWAKVSEGPTFVDSFWPSTRDWCGRIGLLLAGYHYIREGDTQAQADNLISHLGDVSIPVMLDFEQGSGDIENFWAVKDAIEARGVVVCLSYIPRWYWQQIGEPDISGVPGLIQSSYVGGSGYASTLYPETTHHYGPAMAAKPSTSCNSLTTRSLQENTSMPTPTAHPWTTWNPYSTPPGKEMASAHHGNPAPCDRPLAIIFLKNTKKGTINHGNSKYNGPHILTLPVHALRT